MELKPIDDFASYYKERCEIEIGRKLAREKKIEDKKRLKEMPEMPEWVGNLLGGVLCISIVMTIIYFLIRFIRWAWMR